ncbi:MAG: N-acyl homoserine lactonase family protein [Chloroflexi bacterium]|nr:N-acyl homoserine lactonase family protein [Chloroflexota bacterium]
MTAVPSWSIKALDTGTSIVEASVLTYLRRCGEQVTIPRIMWVLEGPTTVVVDTSVDPSGQPHEFMGESFERSRDQLPENALKAAGVSPKDVEFVILTHLHWDHAGNCRLFPDAKVVVQEVELRYAIAPGRFFRRGFLSPESGWPLPPPYVVPNLQSVRGEVEVAPGLVVVPAPGHTPGSQAVIVNTASGTHCIAGDAIMTYDNLEFDTPPGYHVDADASVDSIDLLRSRASVILPSHDYRVFRERPVTVIAPL